MYVNLIRKDIIRQLLTLLRILYKTGPNPVFSSSIPVLRVYSRTALRLHGILYLIGFRPFVHCMHLQAARSNTASFSIPFAHQSKLIKTRFLNCVRRRRREGSEAKGDGRQVELRSGVPTQRHDRSARARPS